MNGRYLRTSPAAARSPASLFGGIVFRFVGAMLLFTVNAAIATPIDVLWYTYGVPSSIYVSFYSSLAGAGPASAASYPESDGLTWNVTFWGPSSPAPDFRNYDVLAIHSGEAWGTGVPGQPDLAPNYSGILSNKTAIEAARGNRTFISGADADFHASRHDSGLCPNVHCGAYDGALGYVINSVNWAASGAGLGIVSFYHGEFPGSLWWDDPNSFLKSELQGKWFNLSPDENAVSIPASAAGYPTNNGLTSEGLSNWFNSFHGGFSIVPGYVSTLDSVSRRPGASVSLATIDLCRPTEASVCLAGTVDEPSSVYLLAGSMFLLFVVLKSMPARRRAPGSTTYIALPEFIPPRSRYLDQGRNKHAQVAA